MTSRRGFDAVYDPETHTYSQPKSRPKWVDGAKVSVALAPYANADDPIAPQRQAPGPPSTFDATPGDGQVTLTWTAPEEDDGITSWHLRYGEVDENNGEVDWGAWTRIAGSGRTTTAHAVTGLDNGTGYGFQIRAMAGEVEGTESVTVIAMLPDQPSGDPQAPPVITGSTAFTVTEGETAVGTLTATDEDTAAEDLAWSLAGGRDRNHFAITAAGVLTFRNAKDYENPDDSGGNGTYNVTVQVSDGGRDTTAGATVTLENRNEAPAADAGADQGDSAGGATVTLQGSGSDPDDGDSLTYGRRRGCPFDRDRAEDARRGSERTNPENGGSSRVAGQTGVSCEVTPEPLTPAPPTWSKAAARPVPGGPAAGASRTGVQWCGCVDVAAATGSRAHAHAPWPPSAPASRSRGAWCGVLKCELWSSRWGSSSSFRARRPPSLRREIKRTSSNGLRVGPWCRTRRTVTRATASTPSGSSARAGSRRAGWRAATSTRAPARTRGPSR